MSLIFLGFFIGSVLVWLFFLLRYQSIRSRVLILTKQIHEEELASISKMREKLNEDLKRNLEAVAKERSLLSSWEDHLKSKAAELNKNHEQLRKEHAKIDSLKKDFTNKEMLTIQHLEEANKKLEEISSLSHEEAKTLLLEKVEKETIKQIEDRLSSLHQVLEKESIRKAQELLFSALERKTQTLTCDLFLSELPIVKALLIPSIIGKEGRNIHSLENLLQVKLIIEENRLLISSHDPKKRFLAQKVLEELLKQTKISLPIINEIFNTVSKNLDLSLQKEGWNALQSIDNEADPLPELSAALGNLSLRSSSGQNVLKHSLEVAELMGIFAAELNLRPKVAKLMGLFHDIGKALPPSYGDTHASAGKAFLGEHLQSDDIINAVAAHHGECVAKSPEARLLPICDRLSAQLPGIRSGQEPSFLPLVRQCEHLSKQESSILSAWAHYAGSHIELIIRHNGHEKEASLQTILQKRFASIPLPVNITFLNLNLK